MKLMLWLVIGLVLVAIALAILTSGKKNRGVKEKPARKRLLTEREEAMYNRLTQSLPDLIVLTQVSFGALLTAKAYAARNTFDRKIADFVVCDKSFQVLAIIELDDRSHRAKKEADADRDALLAAAKYRVIRYPNIPDVDTVRKAFAPPPLGNTIAERIEPTLEV